MKINDYITYINTPEDAIHLQTKLLPVNMRLFNCNAEYRDIITRICEYIRFLALSQFEDYSQPYGMSGANAAIPFNIIGIITDRGKSTAKCEILINPVILEYYGSLIESKSNCGSIRLKESISVERYPEVCVEYHDEAGFRRISHFDRSTAAFTIQHEIDHNNGILITDK